MDKEELIQQLAKEIKNCRKCALYRSRENIVVGSGSLEARVMFIGEAPGYWEDKKGEPFVGAAGKVFDELLNSVGMKRSDVYIANLLKCRPPQNRDPSEEEIKTCSSYLERQIDIIKPEVICPLGRYSMKFIMEKYGLKDQIEPISKIHGKVFVVNNLFQSVKIIPFYHPAVATYHPGMKNVLMKDFEVLRGLKTRSNG